MSVNGLETRVAIPRISFYNFRKPEVFINIYNVCNLFKCPCSSTGMMKNMPLLVNVLLFMPERFSAV